jgi:hypothetical protein
MSVIHHLHWSPPSWMYSWGWSLFVNMMVSSGTFLRTKPSLHPPDSLSSGSSAVSIAWIGRASFCGSTPLLISPGSGNTVPLETRQTAAVSKLSREVICSLRYGMPRVHFRQFMSGLPRIKAPRWRHSVGFSGTTAAVVNPTWNDAMLSVSPE